MEGQRRPELWGGLECTVNRMGDGYFDQLERSGHAGRVEDLERFASLGLRALRYPILWERTASDGPDRFDWGWADERLGRLRELGLEPIIGLLHHGSGPRYTSLLDPGFPEAFARYAGAVAVRYPWVRRFTPINEPLTTARFSCLYGHWYPHHRDDRSFVRALLNQCRATVLAMQGIREAVPDAELVQTDDLGRVFGTSPLADQAAFENERRWLGWDLLCGRVLSDHPLRHFLLYAGASDEDLAFFAENPTPPQVIGINHYITSDRFLDHRLERYPAECRGGNGRDHYADVEAVRVCSGQGGGLGGALWSAWQRYGIPVALTEVHIGCSRGEQLRWFRDAWRAAMRAIDEGVEVRAVTAWSLLGSFDWSSLLTQAEGRYEPGVFDVRGPEPRPTALARLVRALARGAEPDHPVLGGEGWWRRPIRLAYPAADDEVDAAAADRRGDGYEAPPGAAATARNSRRGGVEGGIRGRAAGPSPAASGAAGSAPPAAMVARGTRMLPAPLLVTGATGTLGRAFARVCALRGLEHRVTTRGELDVAAADSVRAALERLRPWAVVNTAGYVRVDEAESDHERCRRENATGPATLARICSELGIRLVTFSSDLVFDGGQESPYTESATPSPRGVYGLSKLQAEKEVLGRMPEALVIRTSAFFGPWDEHNFLAGGLRALAAGDPWRCDPEGIVSPTYVPDLVSATLDLLIDGQSGIWHLANQGAVGWTELARRAARMAGYDRAEIVEWEHPPQPRARRPRYSALGSERGALMPPLDDALRRFFADRVVPEAAQAPVASPVAV